MLSPRDAARAITIESGDAERARADVAFPRATARVAPRAGMLMLLDIFAFLLCCCFCCRRHADMPLFDVHPYTPALHFSYRLFAADAFS